MLIGQNVSYWFLYLFELVSRGFSGFTQHPHPFKKIKLLVYLQLDNQFLMASRLSWHPVTTSVRQSSCHWTICNYLQWQPYSSIFFVQRHFVSVYPIDVSNPRFKRSTHSVQNFSYSLFNSSRLPTIGSKIWLDDHFITQVKTSDCLISAVTIRWFKWQHDVKYSSDTSSKQGACPLGR